MGKIMKDGKQYGVGGISDASDIAYGSGTVESALDALSDRLSHNLTITASSESDFISQILDTMLTWGIGSYAFGATRTGYYACTCFGSVTTATRCIVQIVPQPANLSKVLLGESNGGTKTYKQIATTTLS